MKKKFALLILVIYIFSSIAMNVVNAEEAAYEHDAEYAEKMPYIWMTFDYEGAAAEMTSDGSPHGVELIDSEEGVVVSMLGEINDPTSDPYLYFPLSNDLLSDLFCEEAQAVSIVLKTNVAIKYPDTVNQPELFFRTIQDPTFARVGHPDWTDYFAGNDTWAPGTEGYQATEEWQILTFDMSKHDYWTSVPDRLRLDLFDVCLDVDFVIKGIAFFTQPEFALEWDGDFERVAFEEEYKKSQEPTQKPEPEPTETPDEEAETPKPTATTSTEDDNSDNKIWIYIAVAAAVVVIVVVVIVVVRKGKKDR